MITGVHLLFNSADAEADRAFLSDVLGWRTTVEKAEDDGWLIFKAPTAELGVHSHGDAMVDLHLMCDDIATTVADLRGRGVKTGPVRTWAMASAPGSGCRVVPRSACTSRVTRMASTPDTVDTSAQASLVDRRGRRTHVEQCRTAGCPGPPPASVTRSRAMCRLRPDSPEAYQLRRAAEMSTGADSQERPSTRTPSPSRTRCRPKW